MVQQQTGDAGGAFLARVQQRSGIESRTEAQRLTEATLSALQRRLSGGQFNDLARNLPPALQPEREASGQAAAFDKSAFLDSVSGGISTVDPAEVELAVNAVLNTVREWLPDEEVEDTLAQLPRELSELFAGAPGAPRG
ncbi:DUF2267 domain-containing protein [Streptomonospora wellingtoniae]|uniref:DUF2267 domain-containing protein n=1 Tax=Streptomonospora wellingtoniae TaxID=3075544 RepID=A0ABU2KXW0_9ACTN|nr:DUF2267 domain-containing protein [Streptomonospora sp. DSM 45055]MDT0304077.1 DUF2267 domain-containing protein [Streptomonospora sp. DSM 45055]